MKKNPLYENAIIIAPESEGSFFASYRIAFPEVKFDLITVEAVEAMFKGEGPDPFLYFKGRNIVIRGYQDGKRIANALEPLPSICVSWDIFN